MIKDYVEKTQYHNSQDESNKEKNGYELCINLCQDLSHIILNIPTILPNSLYYKHSFLWLVFYIISFNEKFLNRMDIYEMFPCNYEYLPSYNSPQERNGNSQYTSVLCYLYLLDPNILINFVINELRRIKELMSINISRQIELFTKCENEISKLKLPLLNMLVLVILNCGNYNVYNTANNITYDQFNNQIVFYIIKRDYYDNIIKTLEKFDENHDLEELNYEVIKENKKIDNYSKIYGFENNYIKTQTSKSTIYQHLLHLFEIKNATLSQKTVYTQLVANYNFIYDSPFVLTLHHNQSGKYSIVLKPNGNGYFQLIDPNNSCKYFERTNDFNSEKYCLFRLESYIIGDIVILTVDDNTINNHFAHSFGFNPKKSTTDIWKKMRECRGRYIMDLKPILSTYKAIENIGSRYSFKENPSFSCELDVENQQHEIEFINCLFVLSKKNKLYRYNEEKNLEQIGINEFYHELSYDQNQKSKILFDELKKRYYLYIGDYTWVNINHTSDVIHIEYVNSSDIMYYDDVNLNLISPYIEAEGSII